MPVAMIDSTGTLPATYFIHTGQIEEPLVMTDASKAKVWDAYVEPFGTATVFGTPSAGLDLRLPGQFTQAETGALSQNWNRDYDTSLGRYIEADPLGIEAGQSVYGYVDSNPLDWTDPEGLAASITRSGNTVSISVAISLTGKGASTSLATQWQNEINNIWNKQKWNVNGCDVEIKVSVSVGGKAPNQIRVVPMGTPGRDVVKGGHEGTWYAESGPWAAAHETGHLMHLPDQYTDRNGVSIPNAGWENNIMGDYNGAVEQRNVRQAIKNNRGNSKCKCLR